MTDTTKLRAGIVIRGYKPRSASDTRYDPVLDVNATEALMREAADEIEELRRENAELRNEPKNSKRKWKMPLP